MSNPMFCNQKASYFRADNYGKYKLNKQQPHQYTNTYLSQIKIVDFLISNFAFAAKQF